MEAAAKTFFLSPRFAVAGASPDKSKFGYRVLTWYHVHGLPVTAINPKRPEIKLPSRTYAAVDSPASLSVPSQTSLSIITPPPVTKKVLEEAKAAGVPAVWLQPGSFDTEGLEYAKANFQAAVGGDGGMGGEERMMDDPIPMPGSFLFDLDQPVRPTLTKARPSLYIPPQSPSAASSLSKSFLSSHIPNSSNGSRKRARYDLSDSTSTDLQQIPQDDGNTDQSWAASTASYDSLRSPTPLVSTNYRLAGGWDTPTAAAASIFADGHDSAFADYRPSRFALQTQAVADDYVPSTPDVLSRERNGHKRALSSPQYQGWGKAVYNVIGGVAGKVFNFCLTSAFRGFYAGGGRGYAVDISAPTVTEKSTCMDVKEKEDVFNENYLRQHYREGTPIPGEFPVEGFIEDYMTQVQFRQGQDRSTPCRTAGEKASSGLKSRDTWVIVKNIETDSRESSPTRKIPKTSTFSQSRPISRGATAVRPRLAPSRPSRSSFAGSPSLAAGQPTSFASPRRQIETSNAVHRPQTPEGRHRRSQSSIASPRRSESVRHNHVTPASPDVQKFEKKLRQKERAQQDSIERLAQQTKDMIREAREALGTRINIEDEAEMEDEGYGEGTELMSESKW